MVMCQVRSLIALSFCPRVKSSPSPLDPRTYWLDGWMCRTIVVDALESNTDSLVVKSVIYHPD